MSNLLGKIWPRFAKQTPPPPPPSKEELRQTGDIAKLAEYQNFDAAVGATPTQETLLKRFRDAVTEGHARVVADTLDKGLPCPAEIDRYTGFRSRLMAKPLEVAAENEWADMTGILVKVCDAANLEAALRAPEGTKNIDSTRAIRAEMTRRETSAPVPGTPAASEDPMALQAPLKVSKPLQI